jgi:hypothetical protein
MTTATPSPTDIITQALASQDAIDRQHHADQIDDAWTYIEEKATAIQEIMAYLGVDIPKPTTPYVEIGQFRFTAIENLRTRSSGNDHIYFRLMIEHVDGYKLRDYTTMLDLDGIVLAHPTVPYLNVTVNEPIEDIKGQFEPVLAASLASVMSAYQTQRKRADALDTAKRKRQQAEAENRVIHIPPGFIAFRHYFEELKSPQTSSNPTLVNLNAIVDIAYDWLKPVVHITTTGSTYYELPNGEIDMTHHVTTDEYHAALRRYNPDEVTTWVIETA